jgi:hypothetical protein
MIIGAARYQLVQPALGATRTSEYAETQQKSIQLADDKVTLNASRDAFNATYERPVLARKEQEHLVRLDEVAKAHQLRTDALA